MQKRLVLSEKEYMLVRIRKNSTPSKAEIKIALFLRENDIEFYDEFYFKEFKRNGKLKLLFFDFYIPLYRLAIEYDGEQHYTKKYKGKFLINSEENDFLKNAFCKKNGINLLRVKYTDYDNIENIICKKFDEINPINNG